VHETRLLKGAWDVTLVLVGGSCMGWCMVKVQCFLLYSSRNQEGNCLKGRSSWSQAVQRGPWSILQHKSYTHCAATYNMDAQEFCSSPHVSQMEAKTDMALSLASTMQFCIKL